MNFELTLSRSECFFGSWWGRLHIVRQEIELDATVWWTHDIERLVHLIKVDSTDRWRKKRIFRVLRATPKHIYTGWLERAVQNQTKQVVLGAPTTVEESSPFPANYGRPKGVSSYTQERVSSKGQSLNVTFNVMCANTARDKIKNVK